MQTLPFGAWASPISAQRVAAGAKPLAEPRVDGHDIYWLEGRAAEGGRVVVMRAEANGTSAGVAAVELTPAPFNVRTRVHEYGGGAYLVADGTLYFSHFTDNLVYRQRRGAVPEALTRDSSLRYADFELDRRRGRLIAVCEDHTQAGEARNYLAAIGLEPALNASSAQTLASGHDFYMAPRLSPDGSTLVWLCWNHPLMPWNGCELWCADVQGDGTLGVARKLAGGTDESLCQPVWSPDGALYVVSDASGWWNLYRVDVQGAQGMNAVLPMAAEFGQPQWQFGQSMYCFTRANEIVATYIEEGVSRLARIELSGDAARVVPIGTAYTEISSVRAIAGNVVALAGSPTTPVQVVRIDSAGNGTIDDKARAVRVLAASVADVPEVGYLSQPQSIRYVSNAASGRMAYAFFYPPTNRDCVGPSDQRPPLLVISHGGPTSMTTSTLRLSLQFWTSRGFAVLDVNYGGSTGYGRAYMNLLQGRWGVVDVEDCVAGARYVAEQGWVDPQKMAIRGASAGGFTTLCALAFHDVFKAGASYFGVSDLAGLDADTHKFESRYNNYLIAPAPERERLYRERSPALHADRLSCPMIFLQGLDDKVVVPAQSQVMVDALRARGIPVAYLTFEGEGHGFRKQASIQRSLEAELYFYSRIFGFEPADAIEPVEIERV